MSYTFIITVGKQTIQERFIRIIYYNAQLYDQVHNVNLNDILVVRQMVKYTLSYVSNNNTKIHLELVSIVKSQFLAPYHYLVGCSVLSQTLAQIPPIMALLEYLR